MSKNKKILTAVLIGAVCITAAIIAVTQLSKEGTTGNTEIMQNTDNDVTVREITGTASPSPSTSSEVKPLPIVENPTETSTQTPDPVIDPAKEDTSVVVSINEPVTTPVPDNKDEHINKGESKDTTPTPAPTETLKPTDKPKIETTPKPAEPSAGDKNEKGQVWVQGFGWVTPGDGAKSEDGHSDGDINKQVGEMGGGNP